MMSFIFHYAIINCKKFRNLEEVYAKNKSVNPMRKLVESDEHTADIGPNVYVQKG